MSSIFVDALKYTPQNVRSEYNLAKVLFLFVIQDTKYALHRNKFDKRKNIGDTPPLDANRLP